MTPSKPWRMSRISQVVKRMKKVRVQTLAFMYMDQEKWFLLFEPQSLRLLSGSRITCSCLYCMEKAMATHSSTLAWEIPWMEEPGRLQSMGLQRVGHDWAILLSRIGEGNGNPLQCSCLENPRDGGARWTAVCGVTQSWTQLKWLSSSSSSLLLGI